MLCFFSIRFLFCSFVKNFPNFKCFIFVSLHLSSFPDPRFLTGRCAEILVNGEVKGIMGVLHPEVITNFELSLPCSALELSIEDIY